ncbi:MAG: hypothetical protein WC076_13245, partial [Terrimicrobiaceae bacterium]
MTKNRYSRIIERIFFSHHKKGSESVPFDRQEIAGIALKLGMARPKNLGDVVCSFRFRTEFPDSIKKTAPEGREWVIRKCGNSKYQFVLAKEWSVTPNLQLVTIKIPDATPGLIEKYALTDEQSLLARLRYNRLIDIFTGLTTYSLQSHLRRGVRGVGQVETDEIYVGIDKCGVHSVLPVQAKGGKDKISVVQIEQDFSLCAQDFTALLCRPIAAQFMGSGVIALFEFSMTDDGIRVVVERHYQLVPP